MNQHLVYILDDDKWYGELIKYNIELNPNCKAQCFDNSKDFLKEIANRLPSIVTIDLNLPKANGVDVFFNLKTTYPHLECIIISGKKELQTAITLLKNGAADYIVKNDELKDRLWIALQNCLEKAALRKQVKSLQEKIPHTPNLLIGQKINDFAGNLIEKAAQTDINVSITGETGTGKEVIAKLIHSISPKRKNKNIIALNLSSIPDNLFESELFGHEKGAFTGADNKRIGAFEEANQGVLFLDEIAELNLTNQAKLLRVLQEQTISPLGSNKNLPIDIKLITATHKNLAKMVEQGEFREDLYYRIVGLNIHLPPLRERKEDIPELSQHFLESFNHKNKQQKNLSKKALQKLIDHNFPGNIRELKTTLELAATMADHNEIIPDDISFHSSLKPNTLQLHQTLKEHNHYIVTQLLQAENQNISKVAKILNITRATIYNILNHSHVRNH